MNGPSSPCYILRACPVFDRAPCRVAGLFQGFQEMRPTALSQILEQFFRVAFMLVLSVWLLPKGLAMAAGGAYFWSSSGGPDWAALPSFLLPAPAACLEAGGQGLDQEPISVPFILRELVSLALPVTLSTLMIPLLVL